MKKVASLRYGVIFKKAFCNVEVFKAFVKDILGIEINIDKVETEKSFDPPIGKVNTRFDLFAEDKERRIIVEIQHEYLADHYDRFMHYHCAAILEQVASAKDYQPEQAVYTIVVLTSGTQQKSAVATVEFDPKDLLTGKLLGAKSRVSSQNQKNDLQSQVRAMEQFCLSSGTVVDEWIQEVGGGMNFKRKNLLKIMEAIQNGTD